MLTGYKLACIRLMHGKTQTDIAKHVGCTQEYISMVEKDTKTMTQEMHDKIIDAIYNCESSKGKPRKNAKNKEVIE